MFRARKSVGDLEIDLDAGDASPEQTNLLQAVHDFGGHLAALGRGDPQLRRTPPGRRSHPTAFVDSTVNQVISKPMVKLQQTNWTPRGAHLIPQVRTRVLNNQLADGFHGRAVSHMTDRENTAA